MINITPSMQSFAFVPTTSAGVVLFGETVPTGAPGKTLSGISVVNGITPATNTALVVKVWKGAIGDDLLATVTWATDQAAWTGVYEHIIPTATVSNQFNEGDVLTVECDVAATSATTGIITLFWE